MATHFSKFGTIDDGHFVLDDVNCTGNESNIFDCQYPPSSKCIVGKEEAGVICGVTPGNSSFSYNGNDTIIIIVGPRERCIDQHMNKTVSIVNSSATNLTAGRYTEKNCKFQSNRGLVSLSFYLQHWHLSALPQTIRAMQQCLQVQ